MNNEQLVRVTLDVVYGLNGMPVQDMVDRLQREVEHAIGRGILTGETVAEVAEYSMDVTLVPATIAKYAQTQPPQIVDQALLAAVKQVLAASEEVQLIVKIADRLVARDAVRGALSSLLLDLEALGFGGDDEINGSECVDLINERFVTLREVCPAQG